MTYTVKKGDCLSVIAERYGVTEEALVASNGIKNKNIIYVGQVLTIPGKGVDKPSNNQLYNAMVTCLDAIEDLPEFKTLSGLLEDY